MGFIELFLIGVGLSMDAFAVSVCKGLGMSRLNMRQAVVISLCARRMLKNRPVTASAIGSAFGLLITVVGYTLGHAFIYGTPAYAVAKLPFQILQTAVGSAAALLLCWKAGLVKLYNKQFGEKK